MAQYTDGTVTVTNGIGSDTVTGSGTLWLTNAQVGDLFMIAGETVPYTVAAVNDNEELILSTPYTGQPGSSLGYFITRDFTPNYGFPEIHGGDRDWPATLTTALRMIDAKIKEMEDRIVALGG